MSADNNHMKLDPDHEDAQPNIDHDSAPSPSKNSKLDVRLRFAGLLAQIHSLKDKVEKLEVRVTHLENQHQARVAASKTPTQLDTAAPTATAYNEASDSSDDQGPIFFGAGIKIVVNQMNTMREQAANLTVLTEKFLESIISLQFLIRRQQVIAAGTTQDLAYVLLLRLENGESVNDTTTAKLHIALRDSVSRGEGRSTGQQRREDPPSDPVAQYNHALSALLSLGVSSVGVRSYTGSSSHYRGRTSQRNDPAGPGVRVDPAYTPAAPGVGRFPGAGNEGGQS